MKALIQKLRTAPFAPAGFDALCNIAERALTPAPEVDGARSTTNAGEGAGPSTLAVSTEKVNLTTPSASLRGGPAPVKHWSMQSALEQIARCQFTCEGGLLENNDAWRWLVGAAKVGPEFWPGQGVWFEIEAEAAGKKLTQWVHFYIVGCQMDSGTDSRYWTYDLSYDPPAPYHYGTTHFIKVRGERLRLEKPKVVHV